MVLFGVNAIRLILMIVPFMIVIVFFVMVAASGLVVFGSERQGRHRYWNYKGCAQHGRAEKTGSDCSHAANKSNRMATIRS